MSSDFIFRKATFGGFNRDDVLRYINEIKTCEEKLNNLISEKDKEIEDLKKKITEAENKNSQLQTEFENEISKITECHNNEIECIKNEYEEKIQNGALADRSVQEQVGSAMLDVRRYADLLIHETCERIDKMSEDADAAAAKTLSRVLDISSGIQAFSDKLNSIMKDILDENENICRELTGFKGTLKLPYEEASGKIQADILGE